MNSQSHLAIKKVPRKNLQKAPVKKKASEKMMDFLARRDHSERELRLKLKKDFSTEEINNAIVYAQSRGWLPTTLEEFRAFAEKIASSYLRRGKSSQWINQKLKSLGLPKPNSGSLIDIDGAIRAAKTILRRKRTNETTLKSIQMSLKRRGFSDESLRSPEFKDSVNQMLKENNFSSISSLKPWKIPTEDTL